jgi:hypothetical protein
MKSFLYIVVMAGAAYLGYQAEPGLRLRLTGKAPGAVADAASGSAVEKLPGGALKIALGDLTPDQLPRQILLLEDAKVADPAAGIEMIIKAGNRVKPVSIDGNEVVISPGDGPFRGRISIAGTDLLQQIATNPPLPAASPTAPPAGESEEPAPIPAPVPAPEPPPAPTPPPMPEPIPEAVPASEPAPTAPAPAGPSDVVGLMQQSIKAAQIKEFTFDQVLEWAAAPDETIGGETYQTGLASYKAETIFGVKTIQAKALIKGGVVQRWIWPKSGMEIK